jgi:hypothetical protein
VETIIEIHEKFSQFIQDIFLNDSIFVDAFNQVCVYYLFLSSILFSINRLIWNRCRLVENLSIIMQWHKQQVLLPNHQNYWLDIVMHCCEKGSSDQWISIDSLSFSSRSKAVEETDLEEKLNQIMVSLFHLNIFRPLIDEYFRSFSIISTIKMSIKNFMVKCLPNV